MKSVRERVRIESAFKGREYLFFGNIGLGAREAELDNIGELEWHPGIPWIKVTAILNQRLYWLIIGYAWHDGLPINSLGVRCR